MKIIIKTFAALKEAIGEEVVLDIQQPVDIPGVKKLVSTMYSAASDLIDRSRVSVDLVFVDADYILNKDIEIYFIPPSSGG